MGNFVVALNAVAPLLLFMLVGLFARHAFHFTDKSVSTFNKLLFGLFLPSTMFSSVYFTKAETMAAPAFIAYGFCSVLAVAFLAYLVVTHFVKDDKKRGAMIQAIYRSNFILLGVPLVENIYGPEAVAVPMLLAAFVVPLYNVLAVIILETFRGGKSTLTFKKLVKGVLTNPMIVGALLGLFCRLLPFPLPAMVVKCVKQMAATTTPLALVILGISFTVQAGLGELRYLVITIFSRLVLAPLLVVGVAIALGLRGVELATLIGMAATPCAVASFAMAQQMDSDGQLAGNCVIFSTAISFVTMFFWILAVQSMGLL